MDKRSPCRDQLWLATASLRDGTFAGKIQSKENKKKESFIFYFCWPENGRVLLLLVECGSRFLYMADKIKGESFFKENLKLF
jgi:hypothetical protein